MILYWLWQNIWQVLLFFQLFKINSYDMLLNFTTNMELYTNSVLVRVLYVCLTHKGWSFAVFTKLSFLDYFCGIVAVLFFVFDNLSRYSKWIFGLFAGIVFWTLFFFILAYLQASLMGVIFMLRILGVGSLLLECVLIVLLLIGFIQRLEVLVNNR